MISLIATVLHKTIFQFAKEKKKKKVKYFPFCNSIIFAVLPYADEIAFFFFFLQVKACAGSSLAWAFSLEKQQSQPPVCFCWLCLKGCNSSLFFLTFLLLISSPPLPCFPPLPHCSYSISLEREDELRRGTRGDQAQVPESDHSSRVGSQTSKLLQRGYM